MIERTPILNFFTHVILFLGFLIAIFPFVMVVLASTHNLTDVNRVPMPMMPGSDFWLNIKTAWTEADLGQQLVSSMIVAVGTAAGKVIVSAFTAYAIVYFRFPGRTLMFWAIFITLMLPLEVRIVPTYAVAANVMTPYQAILDVTGITWLIETLTGVRVSLEFNLLNSYPGLILPLVATATGTFLYRQFFLTIPDELTEAARMDGAGPFGRFFDVTLPQLKEVLGVVILLRIIWDFKEFDLLYLMTGGGPVNQTRSVPLLVYQQAFGLNQMGAASTSAVGMMVVMGVLMAVYLYRSQRTRNHDASR